MIKKAQTTEQLPLNLLIEKKSQTRFFLIACFVLVGVNSLLLKPLSIFFNNDILFKHGFLPYLMELLILICDVLFYTVTFSSLSYSICFFGKGRHLSIGYIAIYALGEILDIGMTWIINKYLHPLLFFEIGIYFVLSISFLGVFHLIITLRMKRYQVRKKEVIKANALLSQKKDVKEDVQLYPFVRFFSAKNPLQWCSLVVSILLALPFLVPKLIQIFQALPIFSEVLKAVALFLAYTLLAVISYFSSLLLISHFFKIKESVSKLERSAFLEE